MLLPSRSHPQERLSCWLIIHRGFQAGAGEDHAAGQSLNADRLLLPPLLCSPVQTARGSVQSLTSLIYSSHHFITISHKYKASTPVFLSATLQKHSCGPGGFHAGLCVPSCERALPEDNQRIQLHPQRLSSLATFQKTF